MAAEHDHLYEELEQLLNDMEVCGDAGHRLSIKKWYKRIHTALDRVYRREAGITCPPDPDQKREGRGQWQNTIGSD